MTTLRQPRIAFPHAQRGTVAANGQVLHVHGGEQAVSATLEFTALGQHQHAGLEHEFQIAAQLDGPHDPWVSHVGDCYLLGAGIDGGL
jgi:hypothetical protein